jgi:hypothetical protein
MGRARSNTKKAGGKAAKEFANTLGTRRGAVRSRDDNPAHERLRERARKLKGYTVSVLDDAREHLEIKPICKTTAFLGSRSAIRSYEAEGELHYAPKHDIWVATLYSGSYDSKYRWLVASGPRLQPVLDELNDVIERTVAGYDEDDSPLHPLHEDAVLRITEGTLISHLERIESYH